MIAKLQMFHTSKSRVKPQNNALNCAQNKATAPEGCGGQVNGVKDALAEGADSRVNERRHVGVSAKVGVSVVKCEQTET
jgi:hypothetical protein